MSGLYHTPVISLKPIGNTTTGLLGMVVRHVPDDVAYKCFEPLIIRQLLEMHRRFVGTDLNEDIETS